jgi:hypothetical protein
MIVFGLVFVALLIFYCTSAKNLTSEQTVLDELFEDMKPN